MFKRLTWQLFAIIPLLILALACAEAAWGGSFSESYAPAGKQAFFAVLTTIGVFLLWHYRIATRRDIYPDVLATLLPVGRIYQGGHLHFGISLFQQNRHFLRLTLLIQNTHDAFNVFHIAFDSRFGADRIVVQPPTLYWRMGPAQVLQASIDLLLWPCDHQGLITFGLRAKGRAEGRRRVRFARRIWISEDLSTIGVLALSSFIHYVSHGLAQAGSDSSLQSDSTYQFPVAPVAPYPPPEVPPPQWNVITLWEPGRAEEATRARIS